MSQERITLVGLTGLAGTGKDSAAAHLVREYGFVQASFADPIRSMVLQFLEEAGIDHAWVTERRLKEEPIPGLGVSARELMQTIGTECGRALHRDLWVRHLHLRLGLGWFGAHGTFRPQPGMHAGQPMAPIHDRIVISDVRFLNEAAWLRSIGGHLVRLHRESAPGVRMHASEQQVLDLAAHVDLWNNGPTLEGLHGLIDGVMADLGVERREPVDPCYENPSFG